MARLSLPPCGCERPGLCELLHVPYIQRIVPAASASQPITSIRCGRLLPAACARLADGHRLRLAAPDEHGRAPRRKRDGISTMFDVNGSAWGDAGNVGRRPAPFDPRVMNLQKLMENLEKPLDSVIQRTPKHRICGIPDLR